MALYLQYLFIMLTPIKFSYMWQGHEMRVGYWTLQF